MKTVGNKVYLAPTDECPLCDRKIGEHGWHWRIFHGRADASCGLICQLAAYHVEDPTDEQKEHLRLLKETEHIWPIGVSRKGVAEKFKKWHDDLVGEGAITEGER